MPLVIQRSRLTERLSPGTLLVPRARVKRVLASSVLAQRGLMLPLVHSPLAITSFTGLGITRPTG